MPMIRNNDAICPPSKQPDVRETATWREQPDGGPMTNGHVTSSKGSRRQDGSQHSQRRKHDQRILLQRKAAKKIEPSVVFMMQHLGEPLQVSQLASLCGLAPAQFFKLFKCATGQAPIDFFIHARMRRACGLLKDTSRNIKEVGALLGYNDRFYFSRVFKSVNGIAPNEYRSRMARLSQAEQPGGTAIWETLIATKRADKLHSDPDGSKKAANPS
jgi:AraC-like DNA-binding protein